MALETATYINQLNAANPLGSDPIASGDDHIRLIKAALKATFPNITGPVTPTQDVLNNPFPVGGIIMWSGAISAIPAGWHLCDGTSGTPDLRDRFVVGAGTTYAVGASGGSASTTLVEANLPAHTHYVSLGTSTSGDHSHGVNDPGHAHSLPSVFYASYPNGFAAGGGAGQVTNATGTAYTGISIANAGSHTHTVTGNTNSTGSGTAFENRPPYYALAYIMKV